MSKNDHIACNFRSLVASCEFGGCADSLTLHCNFQCHKIHKSPALFDCPGRAAQCDSDWEGTVSVDCAKGLGIGLGGYVSVLIVRVSPDSEAIMSVQTVQGDSDSKAVKIDIGRKCHGR